MQLIKLATNNSLLFLYFNLFIHTHTDYYYCYLFYFWMLDRLQLLNNIILQHTKKYKLVLMLYTVII